MAAGILNQMANGEIVVRSAGSEPASALNPSVVTAMSEIGIDISQEYPKPLTYDGAKQADVIITMGCGDACPIFPGKTYLDWALADPAGQPIEKVRIIRDEIVERVRGLLLDLKK